VLLIAEIGASSELVEKHRLGKSFHFDDTNGVVDYITEIYRANQENQSQTICVEGVSAYDRKSLAQRMAEVWQAALQEG
jgi:hypothetical protein